MLLVLVNRWEGEKPEDKFWFPILPTFYHGSVGLIQLLLETFGNFSKDLVVNSRANSHRNESKLIRLEPCK